jgi:chemotaxis protein MotB
MQAPQLDDDTSFFLNPDLPQQQPRQHQPRPLQTVPPEPGGYPAPRGKQRAFIDDPTHRMRAPTAAVRRGSRLKLLGVLVLLIGVAFGGFYGWDTYDTLTGELEQMRAKRAFLAGNAASPVDTSALRHDLAAVTKELDRANSQLAAVTKKANTKKAEANELADKLEALVKNGQGEVVRDKDGRLTLQLVDKVLFRSGEAELTERGEKVLAKLGEALKSAKDKQVWVQGHTDNVPIASDNTTFASNWELSSARALNVVHFLQDEVEIAPNRLASVAFSQYRPVSRRKKAKNRRIEIVLFPQKVRVIRD